MRGVAVTKETILHLLRKRGTIPETDDNRIRMASLFLPDALQRDSEPACRKISVLLLCEAESTEGFASQKASNTRPDLFVVCKLADAVVAVGKTTIAQVNDRQLHQLMQCGQRGPP